MGECPFCGSQVDDDLITFGGPCPKCYADIPGEEAATDPGEEVKAAQARKDQMRSTFRSVAPFLLLLPVVAALGLAALWFGVLRPQPEVVLMDFDDLDEYPMPELVAAPPEPQPEDGVADAEVRPAEGTGAQGTAQPAPAAGVVPAPKVEAPSPQPASGSDGGGLSLDLEVSTTRRGTVLSDPVAIQKMIGQRMAAQAPRLNACYEKQLKNDDNLAGRWRLAFVVDTDGKVKQPGAEALSGSVPAFETCLVDELRRWSFTRISRDQPVRKTFTFRPL